jgi:ATP-binding cassette subfamily C exporter for protease/lipase
MLSGGQRQRIGLARAVYGDPALVVLDEPNSNLDDAGEAALMSTVAQLKAKGKTVFLITHRPGAIGAADWLLILNNGELVANGTRDAVISALQQRHPGTTRPADPSGGSLMPQPA